MKSFKQFIRTPKIGFGTIHKDDKSDQLLKPKVHIGFATIHKNDSSDSLLSGVVKRLKGLKEDSEPALEVSNEYHDKYLRSRVKEGTRFANQATPEKLAQGQLDRQEFAHHHVLNNEHQRNHFADNGNENSALRKYTSSSFPINHYLLQKHLDNGGFDALKNKDHNEDWHQRISKETNHPGNALKKPTIVHSGAGNNMADILHHTQIGEHVHFPAYISSSTNSRVAHAFSEVTDLSSHTRDAQHFMHFHLPKGYTKGRHVENITDNPTEHEMILHAGQTFKKVGHAVEPHPTSPSHEYHHHHFVPVED